MITLFRIRRTTAASHSTFRYRNDNKHVTNYGCNKWRIDISYWHKFRICRKGFQFLSKKLKEPRKNLKTFNVPSLGLDLSIFVEFFKSFLWPRLFKIKITVVCFLLVSRKSYGILRAPATIHQFKSAMVHFPYFLALIFRCHCTVKKIRVGTACLQFRGIYFLLGSICVKHCSSFFFTYGFHNLILGVTCVGVR
jgi:hypothetical protein